MKYTGIILITLMLFGCSSVKQITETNTEVRSIPVPTIEANNIPGVLHREIPIEEIYTGEVIIGKIKDTLGNVVAEIQYRPRKKSGDIIDDTIGTFSALVIPPPIKSPISTTTTKKIETNSFYDKISNSIMNIFYLLLVVFFISFLYRVIIKHI